jgi:hypothetical protein
MAFGLPGNAATINEVAKTIALTVPYGTDLTTLAPTYTLSTESAISPMTALPRHPELCRGPWPHAKLQSN